VPNSLPPPPEQRRGTGNGGCGQFITRCLHCSFLLTLFPCSSVGPFHGGGSPSGTGCSSVGHPWGHKPCQLICSGMGSSLHRSTGPGRSLLQRGLPMSSQPPSGIHMLRRGVPSTGYRWRSAPPWTSMDCSGTTCLTMVCITSCKGRCSALTLRASSPRPLLLLLH